MLGGLGSGAMTSVSRGRRVGVLATLGASGESVKGGPGGSFALACAVTLSTGHRKTFAAAAWCETWAAQRGLVLPLDWERSALGKV